MTWKGHTAVVAGFAAALFFVLLGSTTATNHVSLRSLLGHHSAASPFLFAGAALILCILAVSIVFKRMADRRHRVNRDLIEAFLKHIPDKVYFKDRDSRFILISQALAKHFGLDDPRDAVNKTDADMFTSEHAEQALADEREILRTGAGIVGKEEKETWPDGRETWALTTKVPLKDSRGQIIGTMGISHDITVQKQAETRIRYAVLHDHLTGLPNRTLLEDRLSHAIAQAVRLQNKLALLVLDLDRFRNINDSFGHYVGDALLEALAKRLKSCLRESDTLARLSGDEFAIALPMAGTYEDIQHVARKLLDALAEPFQIEARELQISGSIGICRFPEDGESAAALLQYADAAMYEAKKRGGATFCFFSPTLTQATRQQQKLENDLYQACDRGEFVLHYQPILSSETGRITAMEALLRWRHPDQGLIYPNQFVPQLEELGLISEVGGWVTRTACNQNVAWQREGFPPIRITVNVSSQQLFHGKIVESVQSILRDTGLDPRWLELELTESRTMDDSAATIRILQDLKRLGVSLSLDDFGTGWSSLSYLRRFPIDRIKIDRSFVRDVGTQSAAEAVVKSILNLGHSLGLDCVAEGVETRLQRDFLQKQKCAEMQGFLFSKPIAALDCPALLRAQGYGVKGDHRLLGLDDEDAETVADIA